MFLAQTVEDITRIATGNNYTLSGVLLLLILAAGFVMYKIGSRIVVWSGERVDKILERGFKHLDTVDSTMASLKETIGGLAPRLGSVETKLDHMGEKLDDLGDKVQHIDIRLTRHKEIA